MGSLLVFVALNAVKAEYEMMVVGKKSNEGERYLLIHGGYC
jgi:hydrogenase maturation factor